MVAIDFNGSQSSVHCSASNGDDDGDGEGDGDGDGYLHRVVVVVEVALRHRGLVGRLWSCGCSHLGKVLVCVLFKA